VRWGSSTFELVRDAGRAQNGPVPSRDDFCPVAKAAETVGDRWSLLVVREMLRGVARFNELERSLPGISRSVLAQRLRRLEQAGVVERTVESDGQPALYRLTDSGRELVSVVAALNDWGARWVVPRPGAREVDPDGLMMWIRRHVVLGALPPRRVVIEFVLGRARKRRYWLVLRPGEASLCPKHPGFPEDLVVTADVGALYRVFAGTLALDEAADAGLVAMAGPPAMTRAFPRWFRVRATARGAPGSIARVPAGAGAG
jgi:DNA-binding HxlR family transcriptional regulator